MKHLLFFFILLGWSSLAAQTFHKAINSGSTSSIGNIAVLPDSSYSYCMTRGGDPYILRFDANHNFLWSKRYHFSASPPYGVINDFQQLPGGGYIVNGRNDGSYTSFFFARLDTAGNVMWSKQVDAIQDDFGGGSVISPQGTLYFSGYTHATAAPFLIKADLAGNVAYTRTYSFSPAYNSVMQTSDLAQYNDNMLFLAGNVVSAGSEDRQIMLMRLDTMGAPQWAYLYGDHGEDAALSVTKSADGNMLLTGYTSYGHGGEDIFVMKVDTNGNSLWFKTFGTAADERGQCVTQLSDGRIVIQGWTKGFSTVQQQVLMYLDQNGNEITCRFKDNVSNNWNSGTFTELEHGAYICSMLGSSPQLELVNEYGASGCNEHFGFLPWIQLEPYRSATGITWSTVHTVTNSATQVFTATNLLTTVNCTSSCNADAYFIASSLNICMNDSIVCNAVDSTALTYKWYIDSILIDTGVSTSYQFPSSGIFELKLVLTNAMCSDSMTQIVTVDSFPSAGFTYSNQLMVFNFADVSTNSHQWYWDYGDGSFSTYPDQIHLFPDTGTYTVTQTTTNVCGSDQDSAVVHISDHLFPTFKKFYTIPFGNGYHTGIAITSLKDGGSAIAGEENGHFSNEGYIIVNRYFPNGDVKWSYYLDGPWQIGPHNIGTAIAETLEGGVIVCGNHNGLLTVCTIDSSGSRIWTRLSNSGGTVSRIIPLKDSTYMIAGNYTNQSLFLMKLDWYGQTMWVKTFTNGGLCGDMIMTSDSCLVLCGSTSNGNDIYLLKADINGNTLWCRSYATPATDEGLRVIEVAETGYLVAGQQIAIGADPGTLIRVDTTGTLLWSKKIAPAGGTFDPVWLGERSDGLIYVLSGDNGPATELVLIDSAGNFIWSRGIYGSYAEQATFTKGNRILITGHNNANSYVTSIDTAGIGCASQTTGIVISPLTVAVTTINETMQTSSISWPNSFMIQPTGLITNTLCYSDSCMVQAAFTYVASGGDSITFTNNSTGNIQSYHWEFGDGDTSAATSPAHTYTNTGIYTVCLLVYSSCGNVDTFCSSVSITITDISDPVKPYASVQPNPATTSLSISTNLTGNYHVRLVAPTGQTVIQREATGPECSLNTSDLPAGIYMLMISGEGQCTLTHKVILIGNY